ncbi:MAG: hypothetical protein KatS3mg098_143 [Candidatus Parcubacteria bacterium]|nr:MAG: hypothetical protein KatS3mg098_143 [Candidatus Parcubacteria bacterium]
MTTLFSKKLWLVIGIFGGLLFFSIRDTRAAEPLFVFSWKALNFAPSWYQGKILPVNQTKIVVSFEAISTNKSDYGKVLDLSNRNIIWYVNGEKLTQGRGLQQVVITKDNFPHDALEVNIRGEYFDTDLTSLQNTPSLYNKRFYIPITEPEAVLSYKKNDNYFTVGEVANFNLFPFFFNASDNFLKVNWRVNNSWIQPSNDNEFSLKLEIADIPPSGYVTLVGAVYNLKNKLENSSKSITFNVR